MRAQSPVLFDVGSAGRRAEVRARSQRCAGRPHAGRQRETQEGRIWGEADPPFEFTGRLIFPDCGGYELPAGRLRLTD